MKTIDDFAIAALTGLLACPGSGYNPQVVARLAYQYAEEMFRHSVERNSRTGQWRQQPSPLKPTDVDPRTTGERETNE